MIRSPDYHRTWILNKAEVSVYKNYLTLFKDWILLNLKLEDLKIEWYSNEQIENILFDTFKVDKTSDKANNELLEKIYSIIKKIINHSSYRKLDDCEVIKDALQTSSIELWIPELTNKDFVLIFKELNKKTEILTRLDLTSVKWVEKEDIKDVLYKEVWLTKNHSKNHPEKELLKSINAIYKKAVFKMSNNFLLRIPEEYREKTWDSVDEFINFMQWTSNNNKRNWYLRLVDCAILKTMDWYSEIFDNPLIEELDQKLEKIIKKFKTIPWMTIIYENDWNIGFSYNSRDWSSPKHVKWRITYRTKESAKILTKLIYNRKYSKLSFFSDLIWFRVEVDNQEMGENAITLFNRELFWFDSKLDDKWFLSEQFKENCWINFREQLKKPSTHDSFVSASLTWSFVNWSNWEVNKEEHIPPFEVQFVYVWNENESWFSKHEIYDTKKILSVISRLFWYLTLEDIKIIINWIWVKSYIPENEILNHLISPKDGKPYLIKMEISWTQNHYFTTSDVYNKALENLYKTWIIYKNIEENDIKNIHDKYQEIKI